MTTLYGLNTCDTCKKARKWLQSFDIAHTFIDYRNEPPSSQALMAWAAKCGSFPAFINKSSTTWRCVPESRKTPANDAEWVALLGEYPPLIRRPLLVMEDGSVHQGFSEAGFKTLFGVNT